MHRHDLPCRWPQLAKQHKVAVYGTLPQLPTFISFKGGKEEGRIPHVFPGGWAAPPPSMRA